LLRIRKRLPEHLYIWFDDYAKAKCGLSYNPLPVKAKQSFREKVDERLSQSGYNGIIQKLNRNIKDIFR